MHKKISFWMLFKHDFRAGVIHKAVLFIPLLIIIWIFMIGFYKNTVSSSVFSGTAPTFVDYIIDFFKGMQIFNKNAQNINPFKIPAQLLLFNLYIAYLTAGYPFSDLSSYGKNIIIIGQDRVKWWLVKCLWCVFVNIICYMLVYFSACIFSLCTDSLSFSMTAAYNLTMSGVNTSGFSTADFWRIVVFMPITASAALSLMQLTVSLFTKEIYGFILTIITISVSAFFESRFLIGNYLMVMRNKQSLGYGTITVTNGFILCAGIIVISITCGALRFRKYKATPRNLE